MPIIPFSSRLSLTIIKKGKRFTGVIGNVFWNMYGNVFKIVTTFFENLIATYTFFYAQRSYTSCFLWCVLISFFDHVHSEDQYWDVRSKHSIANMFLLSIYHYCIILISEFVFSLFSVNLFHFPNWIKSLKCKLFATVKKALAELHLKT